MIRNLISFLTSFFTGKPKRKENVMPTSLPGVAMKPILTPDSAAVIEFDAIRWDRNKLRNALCDIASDIKAHKEVMRASGHNITWKEVCKLQDFKREATLLCAIQASRRHKWHLRNKTMQQHKEWIMEHDISSYKL